MIVMFSRVLQEYLILLFLFCIIRINYLSRCKIFSSCAYAWIAFPFVSADGESSSEDEEDYLIEYELLSNASTEPWDGNEDMWGSRSADAPPLNMVPSSGEYNSDDSIGSAAVQTNVLDGSEHKVADTASSSSPVSHVALIDHNIGDQIVVVQHSDGMATSETSATSADVIEAIGISNMEVTEKSVSKKNEHGTEELEKVMHEMAGMRENMRNMSDGQRREMAARLAVRMASMFLDDDEEDDN